eukprot:591457-Prorocentrum_minimum.AAC.2
MSKGCRLRSLISPTAEAGVKAEPEREPIARGWRAYARSGSQSREGEEHMLGAGANHVRVQST